MLQRPDALATIEGALRRAPVVVAHRDRANAARPRWPEGFSSRNR